MSTSSRTLKKEELPLLREAQLQAARFKDHRIWRVYMRKTFSYACAVRMCLYMGYKIPSHGFFKAMLKAGQELLKKERHRDQLSRNSRQASRGRAGETRSGSGQKSARVQAAPLTPRNYC